MCDNNADADDNKAQLSRLKLVVGIIIIIATSTAGTTVVLGDDRRADGLDLLLLLLDVLGLGVGVLGEPLLAFLDGGGDLFLFVIIELLLEGLLDGGGHGVEVVVESVLGIDPFLHLLVLVSIEFGLLDHLLDLLLGEAALVVGDGDGLLLTSSLVVSADVEDTVGIDLEGDLDLGLAARGRRDAGHVELAEIVVVLGHRAFAFEDLDTDDGLVVDVGGENLGLLGRDDGVARDQLGHDATDGFDAEGQRGNIEEEDFISAFTGEDTTLDSGTVGDSFIRVDTTVGLFAVEEILDHFLDLRDTSGTTDKDNLIDLVLLQSAVIEDLLDWLESGLEQIRVQLLETGAGQSLGEIFTGSEGFDLDTGLMGGGEGTLGLLDLAAQLGHGALVLGDVVTGLLLVHLDEMLHDTLIEILTTKMGITSGGDNLENAVVDGQKGNIEGTATKIVDDDVLFTLLVQTVGDSRGGRLIDNTLNVETGNGTGILSGLTLGVVEVGRNGDDSVLNLLTQVVLGGLLHLLQNHGGHFLRGEHLLLAVDQNLNVRLGVLLDDLEGQQFLILRDGLVRVLATDKTLDIEQGLGRVDGGLILGGLTNQTLILTEGDVGRSDTVTLIVRDDFDAAVLHDTNAGVGGTKIDTDARSFNLALVRDRGAHEGHAGDEFLHLDNLLFLHCHAEKCRGSNR